MASLASTGSPRAARRTTPTIKVYDETEDMDKTPTSKTASASRTRSVTSKASTPVPLKSSTMGNLQPPKRQDLATSVDSASTLSGMEDILARLRLNDSRKTTPTTAEATQAAKSTADENTRASLINTNKALKKHEVEIKQASTSDSKTSSDRESGSTDSYGMVSCSDTHTSDSTKAESAEMLRMKQELEAAKSVINRQELELAETRNFKHTMDQAMGPPSEIDFGGHGDISEQTIGHLQSAFNATARPFTSRSTGWRSQENLSEHSDFSAGPLPQRGIWNTNAPGLENVPELAGNAGAMGNSRDPRFPGQGYGMGGPHTGPDAGASRVFSGSSAGGLGYDTRMAADLALFGANPSARRNMGYRSNSTLGDPLNPYGTAGAVPGLTSPPLSPIDAPGHFNMAQRGVGLQPSPITPNFPNSAMQGLGSQWPMTVSNQGSPPGQQLIPQAAGNQTYVTPLEPMNYRRLLDKSVSCDWKYIVDKIVCNNDQQASIFLQQKLKVGTADQKFEIVESIVSQAYPLMINRFGNFLVQRCFEHGTPEQVVAIADAIHGNVIALSMDPFGCHVIQKAFDSVPENHKADMVRELLRRIPDTVIHRYACHVWQKLFELRWSGEPPQIMLKVNEALRGMWHEVALGETGSLVVQNIFENCVEEEKRPAIEEVICNIDLIGHGQFGNWCIQHLCEHGSPPDKRRVIDHILTNSYSYSIDQFASKVVEKCLKIGGSEFLDRYLGVITTARPDRPRIPLIDIAGDQYGNYLIQWILMNSHHHQREQVAIHIRKHMVSLRGSKFGSRVAMLCCNPNSVTRPGPGAIVNPFGAPGQPRNQWPRYR